MKIVQFGLRYSPDLGDRVTSDCLSYGLQHLYPGAKVDTFDILNRDPADGGTAESETAIVDVRRYLPAWIWRRVARKKLAERLDKLEPAWRAALIDADLVVVGGGLLFSDVDLDLPIRMGRLFDLLRSTKTPTAIYGVGAARNWSRKGTRLFSKAFHTDLKLLAVRDEISRRAWVAQTPAVSIEPTSVLDPGLLAMDCYGPVAEKANRIGICITDPHLLSGAADSETAGAAQGARAFYTGLINALVYHGHKVTLFTSGGQQDITTMTEVAADPRMAAHKNNGFLSLAQRARTPAELAKIIGSMKGIIAHRLPICIVAFSYGCPTIGLGWDQELQSFFGRAGVLQYFVEDPKATSDTLADLMDHALAHPAPALDRARMCEDAWTGLSILLAQIRRQDLGEMSKDK